MTPIRVPWECMVANKIIFSQRDTTTTAAAGATFDEDDEPEPEEYDLSATVVEPTIALNVAWSTTCCAASNLPFYTCRALASVSSRMLQQRVLSSREITRLILRRNLIPLPVQAFPRRGLDTFCTFIGARTHWMLYDGGNDSNWSGGTTTTKGEKNTRIGGRPTIVMRGGRGAAESGERTELHRRTEAIAFPLATQAWYMTQRLHALVGTDRGQMCHIPEHVAKAAVIIGHAMESHELFSETSLSVPPSFPRSGGGVYLAIVDAYLGIILVPEKETQKVESVTTTTPPAASSSAMVVIRPDHPPTTTQVQSEMDLRDACVWNLLPRATSHTPVSVTCSWRSRYGIPYVPDAALSGERAIILRERDSALHGGLPVSMAPIHCPVVPLPSLEDRRIDFAEVAERRVRLERRHRFAVSIAPHEVHAFTNSFVMR